MSRKGNIQPRIILPDSVYNDKMAAKFINCLMLDGKKSLAENIFYSALKKINSKINKEGIDIFQQALQNVKPVVEVKSRRIGGATYQVPVEVRKVRSEALGIKWIIKYARARKEYDMIDRLANELLDASKGEGASVKKREEIHKIAESNKAFAHYKW